MRIALMQRAVYRNLLVNNGEGCSIFMMSALRASRLMTEIARFFLLVTSATLRIACTLLPRAASRFRGEGSRAPRHFVSNKAASDVTRIEAIKGRARARDTRTSPLGIVHFVSVNRGLRR